MSRKLRGFTLVELAIVLVIISLLMGGILKGQELINSAKAKGMANEFRGVAAAYYGYQDRFRAVPGDDGAADSHVKGTLATNGTRNGRIEGNWYSDSVADESYLFWQHVRLANLLTGNSDTGTAAYLPVNADGGRLGISSASPISDKAYSGNFFVCAANLSARLARQIDILLDDGVGTSGSVRLLQMQNGSLATTGASSDPADGDGGSYIVCAAN